MALTIPVIVIVIAIVMRGKGVQNQRELQTPYDHSS
jgi:hypothetical protein